ncbi:YIP1 family protein [Defluviimonas sp. WL0002]|uniref:YIP1 family protein n=1 Tax=Albidovulum marisflavi TaxID=2984159 RepID=A0ABT2ZFM2_9RHOB|nr:YIP1 family protein [Defluviimonas sp. WL0002]MCV2869938.1 YIP1 family protein [Defluviimonas sp. WL0002]
MAVTDDIVATYRGPRRVVARLLAGERHEARPLAYLLAALVLFLVARAPAMSRDAFVDPASPLSQRVMAMALALGALLPVFYGLAALGGLAARAAGGRGDWFGARIALFWALLAIAPLVLLQGLVDAFVGPGPALTATGIVVFVLFMWFWIAGLAQSEFGERA